MIYPLLFHFRVKMVILRNEEGKHNVVIDIISRFMTSTLFL